jgi:hypothetical protein
MMLLRGGLPLPEISRFFGIIVAMFYSDHPPPHFHVRYGSRRAVVDIATLSVLQGSLPPRALGLVVEWAASIGTNSRPIGSSHAVTHL